MCAAVALLPGGLDFGVVERVRRRYTPEASFEATALACLRHWNGPALYLEAGFGLTKVEEAQFDREPIPARRPVPRFRVLKVVPNHSARTASLYIPPRKEVPKSSLLSQMFQGEGAFPEGAEFTRIEDLRDWGLSRRRSNRARPVQMQALLRRTRVIALVVDPGSE